MIVKIKDISRKVSLKLNIKEHVVEEINRSQWKLLHKIMQEGNLYPVKIMLIGKFSKKVKCVRKYKRDTVGV